MHDPNRVVIHVVGGVGIELVDDLPPPTDGRFEVARSSEPPDVVLRLAGRRASGPLRPAGAPAIEQDSWVAFRDGEQIQLCVKRAGRIPSETMRVELVRGELEGRYLYDHDSPLPFYFPIDQLLVIHAVGVAGGALMHAAAIAGRDGALLVAGPSGAGKTTMSRAAAALGAHVLSDERTIVRPSARGDGWLIGGTPWPGEGGFAENRSLPLVGLILIEHADRDELSPLSPARALAMLYRCHFPPLWDPIASENTLSNLEQLVRSVPAFAYRNRKGPEAAQRLLARVGGVG
ncbi:MAG: hypothetical protein JWM53_1082 [bacterium]|nr:hypothetical protein [bacterium]